MLIHTYIHTYISTYIHVHTYMLSYICSYMHVHTCLRILTDAYVEDGYDGLHVCRLEDIYDEPIDEDSQDELQVKRNVFFYCAVYFSLFVSNIDALLVFL